MSLTSIGTQLTPGRPVEITFAGETGIPSPNQEVCLIGHLADGATGSTPYTEVLINNSGDLAACSAECAEKFGQGSELQLMALAAIRANAGLGTVPQLKAIPLEYADTGFGDDDEALTTLNGIKAEYVVSPYNGQDSALRDKLKATCLAMSGAQRADNNQFGTVGVVVDQDESDPSNLDEIDSQFIQGAYLYNSEPTYTDAELAAAVAAREAANLVPFNPLDYVTLGSVPAPADPQEWPTVGAGLESETVLNRGWTPLFVKPNEEVAFVRTVTSRISADGTGSPRVGAYFDLQDFNVLYFFRKTIWTRFSQPDFRRRKASEATAIEIKSEVIRLMTIFEQQNMFQRVAELSKLVQVERNQSDRSRFDVKIPVNVIPGLHVIATNIEAGTLFDTITV